MTCNGDCECVNIARQNKSCFIKITGRLIFFYKSTVLVYNIFLFFYGVTHLPVACGLQ